MIQIYIYIYVCVYIYIFHILFQSGFLQDSEYSSLCYIVGLFYI